MDSKSSKSHQDLQKFCVALVDVLVTSSNEQRAVNATNMKKISELEAQIATLKKSGTNGTPPAFKWSGLGQYQTKTKNDAVSAEIIDLMKREKVEQDKKAKNVTMKGIPLPSGNVEENDLMTAKAVVSSLHLDPENVTKTKRLPQRKRDIITGNTVQQPPLLLVEMKNENAQVNLLESAKGLKETVHKGIYLRKDLTQNEILSDKKRRTDCWTQNKALSEKDEYGLPYGINKGIKYYFGVRFDRVVRINKDTKQVINDSEFKVVKGITREITPSVIAASSSTATPTPTD